MRTTVNGSEVHMLSELARGLPECAILMHPADADRLLVDEGYAQRILACDGKLQGYSITEAGRWRLARLLSAMASNVRSGFNLYG